MDFDLGFLGSPSPREQDFELPKNEGFQSFAQHMEQDKILTLSTDAETESFSFYDTSDLKALFDIGVQDEDNTEDVNVEALIDEVQDTLQRYDKGQLALPSGEAEVVAESVGKEEIGRPSDNCLSKALHIRLMNERPISAKPQINFSILKSSYDKTHITN